MWNLIIFVIVIFIIYKLSFTSKEPELISLEDFYYDKNGSFKTIKHETFLILKIF